jgi:hypothetical protein
MSKIDVLIDLIKKSSDAFPWIKPIMAELTKTGFKEIASLPQKGSVKDVARVLGIHSESVSKAGIQTVGLNETRQILGNLPPSNLIWSYGFSSGNSSLLAYSNSDLTDLIGCVLIYKKVEYSEPN